MCLLTDIPSQVPPLTPGTNKKMAEALKATFASWEKEQLRLGVPKGKHSLLSMTFYYSQISCESIGVFPSSSKCSRLWWNGFLAFLTKRIIGVKLSLRNFVCIKCKKN